MPIGRKTIRPRMQVCRVHVRQDETSFRNSCCHRAVREGPRKQATECGPSVTAEFTLPIRFLFPILTKKMLCKIAVLFLSHPFDRTHRRLLHRHGAAEPATISGNFQRRKVCHAKVGFGASRRLRVRSGRVARRGHCGNRIGMSSVSALVPIAAHHLPIRMAANLRSSVAPAAAAAASPPHCRWADHEGARPLHQHDRG